VRPVRRFANEHDRRIGIDRFEQATRRRVEIDRNGVLANQVVNRCLVGPVAKHNASSCKLGAERGARRMPLESA